MKRVAYCRVSSKDQNLDLQLQLLSDCDVIYQEKEGAMKFRPELERMLGEIKEGDTLVVYKFDRLARSLTHLVQIAEILRNKNVNLISLKDNIDTTTPNGRLMFNITGAFAEYERDMIIERTNAGLKATKNNGQKLGQPFRHLDFYLNNRSKDKCLERMGRSSYYRLKRLVRDFEKLSEEKVCELYNLSPKLYEKLLRKINEQTSTS